MHRGAFAPPKQLLLSISSFRQLIVAPAYGGNLKASLVFCRVLVGLAHACIENERFKGERSENNHVLAAVATLRCYTIPGTGLVKEVGISKD